MRAGYPPQMNERWTVLVLLAGYIRIDGSVPSSERIQLVHKFQSDPNARVAILSIQASGQGLTLTAASHVVFAELYWNPGHIKQAEDRAHRIGQTSSVNIHYLIAKGTFDTVMWSMLNRKESITGSTLNGRKEYLNADEGDKDKWEFLNFARAWTPSEMVLPLQGNMENVTDKVFFTHFQKDKQHDIRSFFSPNATKEKKRKRAGDDETSLSILPETAVTLPDGGANSEKMDETSAPQDQDFSPCLKRFRTPETKTSLRSRFEGKRRSAMARFGCSSPGTPTSSLTPPRRLESLSSIKTWNCRGCTFSNSSLLPYCKICESPRSSITSESPEPQRPPSTQRDQATGVLSDGESEPGKEPLKSQRVKQSEEEEEEEEEVDDPLKDKQKLGEAEKEDKRQLKGHGAAAVHVTSADADTKDDDEDDGGDGDEASASLPFYPGLQFCASQYTDRIYLYSKDGAPLNSNFIPLDIKLDNWDDLPEAFSQHRENRTQVLRFVQEWSSLAAMKQKLLQRSGLLFRSPTLGLQRLADTQRPHSSSKSSKRYLGKDEVAQASLRKVQQEGGSVRLVTKANFFSKRRAASSLSPPGPERQDEKSHEEAEDRPSEAADSGYLQAVDSQGIPLCLSCQKPCSATSGPWNTRFCTHRCQEEFQLRSSQSYMRVRVLEAERGVCQRCGLHAHQLFLEVHNAPPSRRKEMLENTWLAQLSLKELNEMIRAPVEGHFWQVDHIRPVYSGGGQCSLDNLQTLCTVCHKTRTAAQMRERSQVKKRIAASKVASDITRFLIKK
ncbi:hypothetical protein LDENG_00109640 [Lucifuga dentata]|nr:hypothetical protein LDENG_00109640 [Lucifuga dentata]